MKKLSLPEVLEGIKDTRRGQSICYPLHKVLFIMLAAIICGATSYVKVELFARNKEMWLRKYLELKNGIPDVCTFRNVIKAIVAQQDESKLTAKLITTIAAEDIPDTSEKRQPKKKSIGFCVV